MPPEQPKGEIWPPIRPDRDNIDRSNDVRQNRKRSEMSPADLIPRMRAIATTSERMADILELQTNDIEQQYGTGPNVQAARRTIKVERAAAEDIRKRIGDEKPPEPTTTTNDGETNAPADAS